jgi:hypothetical protein
MPGEETRPLTAEAQLRVARNALPALVARMGGEVTITRAELEELGRAYGGYENLAVQVSESADGFTFRTVRNPASIAGAVADPKNGRLA